MKSSFSSISLQSMSQLSEEVNDSHPLIKEKKKSVTYESTTSSVEDDIPEFEVEESVLEVLGMKGYRIHWVKMVLFWICTVFSGGSLLLICRWIPTLYTRFVCVQEKEIEISRYVIVKSGTGQKFTSCRVKTVELQDDEVSSFTFRNSIFLFNPKKKVFEKSSFNVNLPFFRLYESLAQQPDREEMLTRYGSNALLIPKKNIIFLFIDEILNPFYFFQVFCMFVWFIDNYYIYATVIGVVSLFSATLALIQTSKSRDRLRKMTKFDKKVKRINPDGSRRTISSDSIVNGDILDIECGIVPCDCILLEGECIVNESMLTGESIPVLKTSIPDKSDEVYDYQVHKLHTLYGGTEVIQRRNNSVVAMAIKTGFDTSKGQLILSILYPKQNPFKFYEDSFKFICIMFGCGAIAFVVSSIQLYLLGVIWWEILLRAADVITIIIPPSLPIAMTTGTAFALMRLKKKKIFCISPPMVNVSGVIQLMCFDKTGTLTEDGLTMACVRPLELLDKKPTFSDQVDTLHANSPGLVGLKGILMQAMASCHNLALLNTNDATKNTPLLGDPLEIEIFNSTKWHLTEDEGSQVVAPSVNTEIAFEGDQLVLQEELTILRKFDFKSTLQRMSVVAKDIRYPSSIAYVKGSPEMIKSLSIASSIPSDYDSVLKHYTSLGYRVIAYASKKLDHVEMRQVSRLERSDVECQLTFLGFVALSNPLKKVSSRIIKELSQADIPSVMVTGDNPYTAVTVAKQARIISKNDDPLLSELNDGELQWVRASDGTVLESILYEKVTLCVTGICFQHIIDNTPELMDDILPNCSVFSRMSPKQKMMLIQLYQERKISVGMCGDGANDCSALKAANMGISLSQSEASIAAPFTSSIPNVSCVPIVIRQGRCALMTSFSIFKYIAMYSMTQFTTVIILYFINSNLADFQFLFIDMFVILPIVCFMGLTGASNKLSKRMPHSSLIGLRVFASLIGQFLLVLTFQLIVWFHLHAQSWFVPLKPHHINKENLRCHESTVMFLIGVFETVNVSVGFNIGKPFRKVTNIVYLTSIMILYLFIMYLSIYPDKYTSWLFDMVEYPITYGLWILGFGFFHLLLSYAYEFLVIVKILNFPKNKRFKKKSQIV